MRVVVQSFILLLVASNCLQTKDGKEHVQDFSYPAGGS